MGTGIAFKRNCTTTVRFATSLPAAAAIVTVKTQAETGPLPAWASEPRPEPPGRDTGCVARVRNDPSLCLDTWSWSCYCSIVEPDPKVPCLTGALEQKPRGTERTSRGAPRDGWGRRRERRARRPWDRSGAGAFQGRREALVAPAAGGCQEMELEVLGEGETDNVLVGHCKAKCDD